MTYSLLLFCDVSMVFLMLSAKFDETLERGDGMRGEDLSTPDVWRCALA